MQKLVPCPSSVEPAVRENNCGTAASEQSVLQQESTFISMVKVGRNDLSGHDKSLSSAKSATLQEIFCQTNTDKGCSTTHS
mmetsp:Transcript_1591/g.2988  ORF Transcript_1591/g.2988 Transcript_1591/m.2988 type:complete len:81 (-) Transcript_1591:915-1157(-)